MSCKAKSFRSRNATILLGRSKVTLNPPASAREHRGLLQRKGTMPIRPRLALSLPTHGAVPRRGSGAFVPVRNFRTLNSVPFELLLSHDSTGEFGDSRSPLGAGGGVQFPGVG